MPAQAVSTALAALEEDPSKALGLSFAKNANIQPGQFIPRADALSAPTLSLPTSTTSPSQTYLVICLDLDPPFASFPFAGPINHWLQSAFRLSPPSSSSPSSANNNLITTDPFIINYFRPGPPPGAGPHRYLFLLYEQPENFDVKDHAPKDGKEVGVLPRIRWDLEGWERRVGVGGVVAANWFRSK
ncbi:PEBP-like protein [Hyaloscypha variabilis F]|uniref:PEBP-like protein n=1 Tax=Hyaloscypha variabilis (strain UAMH 11265 / GT02V1 / F) TaxID=1149755 RepID=A0A2J6S7P6_HYAVF|nr:PEBP-like protein [Hyaloscypha variabilis F]